MLKAESKPAAAEPEGRKVVDDGVLRLSTRGGLSRLFRRFLRPYVWTLVGIGLLQVVQAAGNLYLPRLDADMINNGVVEADVDYIWRTGGRMLATTVVLVVVAVLAVYLASWVAMSVGADIRAAVYRKVQGFSAVEMNRFGVSSLTTRSINDVQQVQIFLQVTLGLLVIAVITSTGAVILAIRLGSGLSFLLVIALVLMALITGVVLVLLLPLFRTVQVETDRINQVLREQISGIRVSRAFLRTRWENLRFAVVNADLSAASLRAGQIFVLVLSSVTGVAALSSVAVFWFGGKLVADGSMEIGDLSAYILYILEILGYVVITVIVLILLPRAVASAERIQELLNAVPAVVDPPDAVMPAECTGLVELREVSFGYAGSERPVLKDLSFSLRPGQVSAIIGGTGSGKSTLLNLISRFADASSGTVLVNGVDVTQQSAAQLRPTIGLVPQTAFLFAGTVASNLRFGRADATDEQLWRALEIAQASDFVADMPGRLEAPIDRSGANLSGGQRQRLSIARALVRRPGIYLFDDCFSALDASTDARVRAALQSETRDAAVVIVAQRASTIMHADQIIVLDAGNVAGIGTHEQLLVDCQTYQEIIASQLGEGSAA